MQKKHEELGKCVSAVCILLNRENNGTTFEGGRGSIKKRIARCPATKMSMMGAVDNRVGSGLQSREGNNNRPLMEAERLRRAVAGNNKSERRAAGNGGKRGRLEEGFLLPKRSDCGIGGGRGILDLENKDACG